MLLFDVSLSMESDDVAPNRLDAAKKAGEDFVDAVDPDVDVGLISFSGTVSTDVEPTTDRAQLTKAIDALQLGEGTAIGDAIAAGVHLLQRGQPTTDDSPGTLGRALGRRDDTRATNRRRRAGRRRCQCARVHDRVRYRLGHDHQPANW